MAKGIRWTTQSIIDRTEIYKYWVKRNNSETYPEKLEQLFEKCAELISKFPTLAQVPTIETCFQK